MRKLLTVALAAFFALACATGGTHDASDNLISVEIDNRDPAAKSAHFFDGNSGTILDRVHNLTLGVNEREIRVSEESLRNLRIGAVVEVEGGKIYFVGGKQNPQLLDIRSANAQICLQVHPHPANSFLGRHTCR